MTIKKIRIKKFKHPKPNKLKILLDYLGVEFRNSPSSVELVKKEELEK